jgi:hypothetical protein
MRDLTDKPFPATSKRYVVAVDRRKEIFITTDDVLSAQQIARALCIEFTRRCDVLDSRDGRKVYTTCI